jgi:hypothetical protein
MKLLACLLMVVSVNVFSKGVTAQGMKENGVIISLTDQPCKIKDSFVAYSVEMDGYTTLGCWAADESRVLIRWDGGYYSSFSFGFFEKGLKR